MISWRKYFVKSWLYHCKGLPSTSKTHFRGSSLETYSTKHSLIAEAVWTSHSILQYCFVDVILLYIKPNFSFLSLPFKQAWMYWIFIFLSFSIVLYKYIYIYIHFTWWTEPTMKGSHCIDTLNHRCCWAASIIIFAFINVLATVAISLPAWKGAEERY